MKQVEAHITSKNISTVLVVFRDIRAAAFAKTIIDIEIYDIAFDYFIKQVLEVCKNIAKKLAPSACATEAK